MTKPSGYRTYCTHQPFGGFQIPVPVQNIVVREYARRNQLLLKLSVNELFLPGCYLGLQGLLEQLPRLEGLFMASLFVLPEDAEVRERVYAALLRESASLHLVMESVVASSRADFERIEEILMIHQTLKDCPKTLPEALLEPLPASPCFSGGD